MTIEPSVGIQAFERTDRNSLQNNELDVFPELLMQQLVLSVPACRWHVGLGEALPNQEGVNGHQWTSPNRRWNGCSATLQGSDV